MPPKGGKRLEGKIVVYCKQRLEDVVWCKGCTLWASSAHVKAHRQQQVVKKTVFLTMAICFSNVLIPCTLMRCGIGYIRRMDVAELKICVANEGLCYSNAVDVIA